MNNKLDIHFFTNVNQFDASSWQNLNSSTCPFIQYEFFSALEKSQSVSIKQGWQPHHLVAKNNKDITAILPMFLKSHSWGEYVFDWDWAEAFKRYNLEYYPKLVATIPFTPVCSTKLLSSKHQVIDFFEPLIDYCQQEDINSWHILFCDEINMKLPLDVYQRNTVQFHWFNRDYNSFDNFLSTFSSRKRKNTLKERRSITEQGIEVRLLKSHEISTQELDFFYLTYQLTYLKRGHQPHLSFDFFKEIISQKKDNILLIIASHQSEDIACALFFYDDEQLYGRYWGSIKHYNNLHFELCYYQGIEFCIQNNLKKFNPGTQGEHKIQRGFEPVLTYSYHWIKHPAFKDAVRIFCEQEHKHMLVYQQECQKKLPFKTVNK